MEGARVTRQERHKDAVRMRTQSLDRLDANGRSAYRQPIPAAELERQRDLELVARGERRRREKQGVPSSPRAPPEMGGMHDGGEDAQGASPARRGWHGRLAAREREQDMGREQREEQEELAAEARENRRREEEKEARAEAPRTAGAPARSSAPRRRASRPEPVAPELAQQDQARLRTYDMLATAEEAEHGTHGRHSQRGSRRAVVSSRRQERLLGSEPAPQALDAATGGAQASSQAAVIAGNDGAAHRRAAPAADSGWSVAEKLERREPLVEGQLDELKEKLQAWLVEAGNLRARLSDPVEGLAEREAIGGEGADAQEIQYYEELLRRGREFHEGPHLKLAHERLGVTFSGVWVVNFLVAP
jgi:hypothetical protein